MKIKLLFIGLVLVNSGIICSSEDLQLQTVDNLVNYEKPKCSVKSVSAGTVVGLLLGYVLDDVLNLTNKSNLFYLLSKEFRVITGSYNNVNQNVENRTIDFVESYGQRADFIREHPKLYNVCEFVEDKAFYVEALAIGALSERYARKFFVKKDAYLTNSVYALQKAVISLAAIASLQEKDDKKIQQYCEKVLIECRQIVLLDYFKTYKKQIDDIKVDVNNIKNGKILHQDNLLSLITFLMGAWSKRWFGIMSLLQKKEVAQRISDQLAENASKWYNFAESKYVKWSKECEIAIKKYESMSL